MAFLDWLKAMKSKNHHVKVVKVQEGSIGIGEMAAEHPTGAAAAIKRMMDQKNGPAKILVVGDGCFSNKLIDYSLKMAQRLDCAIEALKVSDAPLQFTNEKKKQRSASFMKGWRKISKNTWSRQMSWGAGCVHHGNR